MMTVVVGYLHILIQRGLLIHQVTSHILAAERLRSFPAESVQLTQPSRTIVLTIEFLNELNDNPLQAMSTIADDTRTAIIESVNLCLDLRSIPQKRKVDIESGVGRYGHVDMSTIKESKWPNISITLVNTQRPQN